MHNIECVNIKLGLLVSFPRLASPMRNTVAPHSTFLYFKGGLYNYRQPFTFTFALHTF